MVWMAWWTATSPKLNCGQNVTHKNYTSAQAIIKTPVHKRLYLKLQTCNICLCKVQSWLNACCCLVIITSQQFVYCMFTEFFSLLHPGVFPVWNGLGKHRNILLVCSLCKVWLGTRVVSFFQASLLFLYMLNRVHGRTFFVPIQRVYD